MSGLPQRAWFGPVGAALVAAAGGAVAIVGWVGWPIEWPWSWLLQLASLPCGALGVAALIVAWRRWRPPLRLDREWAPPLPARARRRLALPWVAGAAGLLAATYGFRRAPGSLNPFDDVTLPTAHALPPSGRALLVRGADVVDVANDRGYRRWPALERSGDVARWSPTRRRLIVGTQDGMRLSWAAVGLDGESTPIATLPRAALDGSECPLPCTVSTPPERILCYGEGAWPRSELVLCARSLDGEGPPEVTWRLGFPPGHRPRAVALADDGDALFYADDCDATDSSARARCLYRAPTDGSAPTPLARLDDDLCAITVAADGRTLAIAHHRDGAPSSCKRLALVDAARAGAPRDVAAFDDIAAGAGGIGTVAFSPDGSQLALFVGDDRPCQGSRGIVTCDYRLYVVRRDGTGLRRVAGHLVADPDTGGGSLTWLP